MKKSKLIISKDRYFRKINWYFLNHSLLKKLLTNKPINKQLTNKELKMAKNTTISVIIPVKNGGNYFKNLLNILKRQTGFKQVEIVIVDSGSEDNSINLAREIGARIIEIKPTQFSHSYSRNLGAAKAIGDYLFFTVQDALIPSEDWLLKCFCLLKLNQVEVASCSEIPRDNADLFYRIMSWNHSLFMGKNHGDRILAKPVIKNYVNLRKNAQISNVACFIKRDVFEQYKF